MDTLILCDACIALSDKMTRFVNIVQGEIYSHHSFLLGIYIYIYSIMRSNKVTEKAKGKLLE